MPEARLIDRFAVISFSRCGPIMVIYRDSFCRASKPPLREITAGLAILEKLVKWKADPSTGGLHLLIVFCGRR
jgi:hypothetical protein